MNNKKNSSNEIVKKISKASNKIIKFNGDVLGLLSLKLGNKNFAYKSLVNSRKLGEEFEETVEEKYQLLSNKALKTKEKLEELYMDINLDSFKTKSEKLMDDIKDLNMESIKNTLVKTETRIYGESDKFYEKEEIIKEEEGFIIKEVNWEKLAD